MKQGNIYVNGTKPQTDEQIKYVKRHIFEVYDLSVDVRDFIRNLNPGNELTHNNVVYTVLEVQIRGFVVTYGEDHLKYVSYSDCMGYIKE